MGRASPSKRGRNLLSMKCLRSIPGGALVDYKGLEGFVPRSQFIISGRAEQTDVDPYIEQDIEVVVVENFGCREKEICLQPQKGDEKGHVAKFNKGDTIDGIVTSITNYGVFVDLGGV